MKTAYQKRCLKIAIVCFTIAALALIGLVMEVGKAYAADKAFIIAGTPGTLGIYTKLEDPKGLVVVYGVSNVIINGQSQPKSKYITHSTKFLKHQRPPMQLKNGSLNPLYPVWLTFLKAYGPQKKGKVVDLVLAGKSDKIQIDGFMTVVTQEEWALAKRMRLAWEQQKKKNAAKK